MKCLIRNKLNNKIYDKSIHFIILHIYFEKFNKMLNLLQNEIIDNIKQKDYINYFNKIDEMMNIAKKDKSLFNILIISNNNDIKNAYDYFDNIYENYGFYNIQKDNYCNSKKHICHIKELIIKYKEELNIFCMLTNNQTYLTYYNLIYKYTYVNQLQQMYDIILQIIQYACKNNCVNLINICIEKLCAFYTIIINFVK